MKAFMLGAMLAVVTDARAEIVIEPKSGVSVETMRELDGKPFTLIGVGMRRKWGFKVYTISGYLEDAAARRAFSTLNGSAAQFVVGGDFRKAGVIHFLRDVSPGQVRDELSDGLDAALDAHAIDRATADGFLAMFDRPMKKDEEIIFATRDDGSFTLDLAGVHKVGPKNPALLRAILGIWLGEKPVSSDVKRALVERIARLQ